MYQKTIHKYQVPTDTQVHEILMPRGAELLAVDWQDPAAQSYVIWALVELDRNTVSRRLRCVPTGLRAGPGDVHAGIYVGTVHWHGTSTASPLVVHVFDLGEAEE